MSETYGFELIRPLVFYREMKKASDKKMRHQLAVAIPRNIFEPKFKNVGEKVVVTGLVETSERETFFKLIGYGETLQQAERMAKGKV